RARNRRPADDRRRRGRRQDHRRAPGRLRLGLRRRPRRRPGRPRRAPPALLLDVQAHSGRGRAHEDHARVRLRGGGEGDRGGHARLRGALRRGVGKARAGGPPRSSEGSTMLGLDTLDVAIGLVFVYLMVSFVCSAAVELVEVFLKNRPKKLRDGIKELLQSDDLVKKVYEDPFVNALYKGKYGSVKAAQLPSYI